LAKRGQAPVPIPQPGTGVDSDVLVAAATAAQAPAIFHILIADDPFIISGTREMDTAGAMAQY
jgi:TPP-dependent indolepyruvate ferredoxin oxidoreductase alpha subunit